MQSFAIPLGRIQKVNRSPIEYRLCIRDHLLLVIALGFYSPEYTAVLRNPDRWVESTESWAQTTVISRAAVTHCDH